jgi:hypothetical protein
MDLYVTTQKQKSAPILGRDSVKQTLRGILNTREIICVYGDYGVGKTHLVKSVLSGEKYTELDLSNPLDYDRMKSSVSHVLIDDVDVTTQAWRDVTERGKLTRGAMIIVTRIIKGIDFCDCIKIEPLSVEHQITLCRTRSPSSSIEVIHEAISKSNGNLRNLIDYLYFSDQKDLFKSPKDFIHDILSGAAQPGAYLGHVIEEHGYSCGIVHENYLRTNNPDTLSIPEDLSIADIYDNWIYNSNWELLPYYCMHGIVKPAMSMDNSIIRETIRAGSAWTKFNNYKMRQSKIKSIRSRTVHPIDTDRLLMIHSYCLSDPAKAVEIMLSYNIQPQDLDVMNHLTILNKIKPKALQSLKKNLRDALGRII